MVLYTHVLKRGPAASPARSTADRGRLVASPLSVYATATQFYSDRSLAPTVISPFANSVKS